MHTSAAIETKAVTVNVTDDASSNNAELAGSMTTKRRTRSLLARLSLGNSKPVKAAEGSTDKDAAVKPEAVPAVGIPVFTATDKEEMPAVVKAVDEEKEETVAPMVASTTEEVATAAAIGDAEEEAALAAAIKASLAVAVAKVDDKMEVATEAEEEATDAEEAATDEAEAAAEARRVAVQVATDVAEVATAVPLVAAAAPLVAAGAAEVAAAAPLAVAETANAPDYETVTTAEEAAAVVEAAEGSEEAAEGPAEVPMVPVTVEVERAPSLLDMLGVWVSGRLSATAGKCTGQEATANEEMSRDLAAVEAATVAKEAAKPEE